MSWLKASGVPGEFGSHQRAEPDNTGGQSDQIQHVERFGNCVIGALMHVRHQHLFKVHLDHTDLQ